MKVYNNSGEVWNAFWDSMENFAQGDYSDFEDETVDDSVQAVLGNPELCLARYSMETTRAQVEVLLINAGVPEENAHEVSENIVEYDLKKFLSALLPAVVIDNYNTP